MLFKFAQVRDSAGVANISTVNLEMALDQNIAGCSTARKNSLRSRYIYGIIFFITNLNAWFFRDYAQTFLPQLHHLKACRTEGNHCIHTSGVLRASLGCFIFFFLMFLTTVKTSKLYDIRNIWHSGWWGLKILLLIISMAIPFFLPSGCIHIYGELARVGAGIFLVLQLVSVIQFIAWCNKHWMPDKEKKKCCSLRLFVSIVFYTASVCGVFLLYFFYAPRPSCGLNIYFIAWTAVLLILMMVVSLHSKVNQGLLSSGIMACYVVYLCWSALRSEPPSKECYLKSKDVRHTDWTAIVGFLIAVCAIVMATFSTGIDSQSFQFRKDGVQEEDDIPYGYGFFHLVFSLGAMYFAMLFVGWNLNQTAREWSIDFGWTSAWVKIINEGFAAFMYVWTLIYPILRRNKVMDNEEQERRTASSATP